LVSLAFSTFAHKISDFIVIVLFFRVFVPSDTKYFGIFALCSPGRTWGKTRHWRV